VHCPSVLCVEGSVKNSVKKALKTQFLILVMDIPYEKKTKEKKAKLEHNVGKRSSSSWGAGRSGEAGRQPRGAPSEAGQAPQHRPEMPTTSAACAVAEAWD